MATATPVSHEDLSSVPSWSFESVMNLQKISSTVREHLIIVYLLSFCALLVAAVGVYLHIWCNIGGLLTFFGCLGSIVFLVMSSPEPEEYYNENGRRFILLMLYSLFHGATAGPLIELVIQFNQRILVTAFVGAAVAFLCFAAAAALTTQRKYMYLGGLLYSSIAILFWLQFASSMFGGSIASFKFTIYFGLLIFLGYVVVDTQKIIQRAESGDEDYVEHSSELFTVFCRWSYPSHVHDD